MQAELLGKLKELKDLSREVYVRLEDDGLRVSDPVGGIAKEQFFTSNVKNITNAIEGLLRGEPAERHMVRLNKDFPDAFTNVKKVKQTLAGKKNAESLNRMEALLTFLEKMYRDL